MAHSLCCALEALTPNAMIDLHTHSTASDGTLTPRQLVQLAAKSKLDAVALTDHDTLGGLHEALEAGKEFGIEVIPGCELSVGEGKNSMHILGLWLDPKSTNLANILSSVHDARAQRNGKIINKLNELGIDITLAEVEAEASGTVGRPHIAKVLCAKGAAKNFDHAFDEFVGNNGKAYMPRTRLSPQKALDALKEDGATSILAHPMYLGLPYRELETKVVELQSLGLDGLEVYYTTHDPRTMDQLLRMADKHNMAISGGSDFHGAVKPRISLGQGKGSLLVPLPVLEELKAYRKERGLWT